MPVLFGQRGNRAFEVANSGKMFLQPRLVVGGQVLFERGRILLNRIQNASLAIHPSFFALTEKTVEQAVRNHLGR